ncbi:TetR family transcriptional regulator [Frateuria sp. Soil773]|uniref:TetR family transcriptional regulator n=1 Tax=Frateuria sp. Soil773 TaxID=1736407 RepID=UPI0006F6747B|nr:TetR family transcriptional regulator [Frateuria sp. Soil773]KRE94956.1 TetR family transcriptional regulator [Frateuria sp. Soil773]
MKARENPVVAPRKHPRQTRSEHLVAAILEAAVRVLEREGAARFTTARVAEAAGVSVGSLYQYFPNKQAILFRLQAEEWAHTGGQLHGLLADPTRPPPERLRLAVRAFFRSECEEAALRGALADAAPLYRDAPEAAVHRRAGQRQLSAFMAEALPDVDARKRRQATDAVATVLTATGKNVSEQGRSRASVDALANAVGEMLCGYLDRLAKGRA